MLSINSDFRTSERGLEFIERWEGLRLKPYRDSAGFLTIGVGHLITDKDGISEGSHISVEQAYDLLRDDLKVAERGVKRNVRYPLNQEQFDSLVSFTFNVGSGRLASSTLLKKLNAGLVAEVPDEFRKWVYAGTCKVQGLVNRREAEALLFSQGRYEA